MAELDEATLFVAIARAGGLAAAEAATGLPRSTLSRRLAALERRLGAQLAKRSPQGFALTAAGEALAAEYGAGLERIAQAEAAVLAGQAEPAGLVRLTAPSPIMQGFLALELPGFFARHPDIWVSTCIASEKVDLASSCYDLAFREGEVGAESLVARRLFEECDALYASPAYLARAQAPREPGELEAHDVVSCSQARPVLRETLWPLTDGAREVAARVRVRVHVGDPMSAVAATVGGVGIGRIPRFVGEDAVRGGGLVRVLPDWSGPAKTIRAVLPHRPTAAARALLTYLAAAAKARWR